MRLALIFVGALLLAGCAARIVPKAPPSAPSEVRGPRPFADSFWRTGHFEWDNGKQFHYWVPGGWDPNRAGYIWFPGEWEPVDEGGERVGWRWVDERWVQLVDLERTGY